MKFILLIALVLPIQTLAHDDHVHEPAVEAPINGGLLRDAAPFKTELVLKGDTALVYIYDKDMKYVKLDRPELTGDYQFPKEKKGRPVVFKLSSRTVTRTDPETKKEVKETIQFYEGQLKGIARVHRFDLHVNLDVGGKKALADFGIDNVQ